MISSTQCSVLLAGTVMKVTLTEKNGMSHATDLTVEEFRIRDLPKEEIETVRSAFTTILRLSVILLMNNPIPF